MFFFNKKKGTKHLPNTGRGSITRSHYASCPATAPDKRDPLPAKNTLRNKADARLPLREDISRDQQPKRIQLLLCIQNTHKLGGSTARLCTLSTAIPLLINNNHDARSPLRPEPANAPPLCFTLTINPFDLLASCWPRPTTDWPWVPTSLGRSDSLLRGIIPSAGCRCS